MPTSPPTTKRPTLPTTKPALRKLYWSHINHYRRLLELAERGSKMVRKSEVEALIKIWESIKTKNFDVLKLDTHELNEILDAMREVK